MQRLPVVQILASLKQVQELAQVTLLEHQVGHLLARKRRALGDNLDQLCQTAELRRRQLRGSRASGILIEPVIRRTSELVLVYSTPSHAPAHIPSRHVALLVRVLHGADLFPDVVAPHRLLETKRDIGVDVRIRPRDDRVPPLALVDIFPRDAVHQQRLLVLLRDDHEADGIGLLRWKNIYAHVSLVKCDECGEEWRARFENKPVTRAMG